MGSEAGKRSTTAGNCCPQQQSRWLSDPSHRLAAASETPANGCRRPHDTPGTPGMEGFRLGKKWRACSEAARTENECRDVALCGTLATPWQTHAHQKSSDPPFLFTPPWDLQRIKDAVITTIKCWCLIEQRALTALRVHSSVSTFTAAHSVMSNTRRAELKHCFILSYHRDYKCNRNLQENILTIFTICVSFHL